MIHDYDYDHDDNQDALQDGEYDNKVKNDFVLVNLLIGFNHIIFSHLLHFYELGDSRNILTVIILVLVSIRFHTCRRSSLVSDITSGLETGVIDFSSLSGTFSWFWGFHKFESDQCSMNLHVELEKVHQYHLVSPQGNIVIVWINSWDRKSWWWW